MRFLVRVECKDFEEIPYDTDDVINLLHGISDGQIEGDVSVEKIEENDRGDLD